MHKSAAFQDKYFPRCSSLENLVDKFWLSTGKVKWKRWFWTTYYCVSFIRYHSCILFNLLNLFYWTIMDKLYFRNIIINKTTVTCSTLNNINVIKMRHTRCYTLNVFLDLIINFNITICFLVIHQFEYYNLFSS